MKNRFVNIITRKKITVTNRDDENVSYTKDDPIIFKTAKGDDERYDFIVPIYVFDMLHKPIKQ